MAMQTIICALFTLHVLSGHHTASVLTEDRVRTSQQHPADAVSAAIASHDAVAVDRALASSPRADLDVLVALAIERDDAAIVRILVQHGANPNFGIGGSGETPLIAAARLGHAEIIDLLLSAGADPDGRAGYGGRLFPLYYAVVNGHGRAVAALLRGKANPNSRCTEVLDARGRVLTTPRRGLTMLMLAAGLGEHEIVDLLLRWGADADAKDADGRRAVDWLKEYKCPTDEIRMLLKRGPAR